MKQFLHAQPGLCPALSDTQVAKRVRLAFFPSIRTSFCYLLLLLTLCCSTTALLSQTTWMGVIDNNWNNLGNWMPAAVPTAADDVVIPSGGTQPTILSGTAAVAQSVTIAPSATLTIQSMASLSIEGDATYGIYNEGTVSNSGTITIGATVSPGFYGIRNFGTFNNNATTGNITINRGNIGINNGLGMNTFTNAGTIKIGNVTSLNSTGVYNEADFQNATGGILEISRTSGSGFYNLATGTLTNAGTITLGKEASISGPGFYNFNEIENLAGATINIDRTGAGINNTPNTSFTNEGLIIIGFNFSVSGPGIYNQNDATFLNTDGEIRIDQFGGAAIDNRINSIFTTTGLIIIGANAVTFGGPGIYNYGGIFTNDGGEIRIDRVSSSGINNTYGTLFVPMTVYTAGSFSNLNDGIITIGANVATALGGPGIHNESYFDGSVISTFLNEGTISINRTSFGIHNTNYSSFTNAGDITIGDVAVNGAFGGPGITNYGTFMHNSGTIQIDRTNSGIHNTNSFTNADTIIIGSIADITLGPGITNYGTFNNNTGGYITIDRISPIFTSAVYTSGSSTMINNGVLKIGTLANIANIGITVESGSTFNNLADGEITIERTARQGIYNNSTFNNIGNIDIGLTTSIGERGIMAAGTLFKNEGNISIDRASVHGIFASSGTFENSGTIDIGKTVGVGSWGFYTGFSSPIVNNLAGGEINIDNVTITGLRHDNGTFTNAGNLNLGSLASIGSWGFWNQATFNNTATGEIHVNRTTMTGMINNANTFTNLGEVYIGDLAAVGDHALYNALGATVRNEACALLSIFAPLNNLGTLVQEGLFKVNTLVAHTNTPGFTNNGVIEYFQGNPIPNVINNDVIIEPINTLCPTDVIQIGGMNSFTIATTWYEDEALTMPAGTYDAMANTFTPAGLSIGTHTLYFEITDDVNTCTQIASIQITIYSMGILYVDEDATGANNGTSWTDAYNDLQDALAAACSCDGTQIWVADGTYYPDEGVGQTNDDRASTFQLCNGVAVYGGFSGWSGGVSGGSDETLLSQRDFVANETILSGDIDENGLFDNGNAYHVVTGSGTDMTARLDGFSITRGLANGSFPNNNGGGMFINAGSPAVINNAFFENSADINGGGLAVVNSASDPLVLNCRFFANNAQNGGGIYIDNGSITVVNSTFASNMAFADGGGMYLDGNFDLNNRPELTNNTFFSNRANQGRGGAMFHNNSNAIIANSIFFENTAMEGPVFYTSISNPATETPTISYSLVDVADCAAVNVGNGGTCDAGMIFNGNPLFVDGDGADNSGGTTDDDLRLLPGSPAINMGDNAAVPADSKDVDDDGNTAEPTPDLDLNERIFNDALDIVDMGAYESQCINPAGTIAGDVACANENAFLTFTATVGTAPFFIIIDGLNGNNEIMAGAGNGNPIWTFTPGSLAVGDHTFDLLSIRDANGCVFTDNPIDTALITINELPVGTIAGDVACANEDAFLTFTATVGTAPFFVIIDGLNGNNEIMAGAGNGNPIWTFTPGSLAVGDHTFDLLSIRDANGCVFTGNPIDTALITINELPAGTIAGDVACANENAFLTFTATVGTAPFFVIIDGLNGNNEIMAGAGNGNPIWTFTPGSLAVGDHTFELLSIRDANGCVFTADPIDTALITINELPAGTIAGDVACANENAFLTFTATVGTAPFFIIIDGVNGNNEIMAGAGNGNPIWTFTPGSLAVGDHTFNLLSIRDANGCVFTADPIDTALITINELPAGTIAGDVACANENAFLTFTATVGTAPFFVIIDGLNGNNEIMAGAGNGNPIWTFVGGQGLADGANVFQLLSVTDANGCTMTGNPIDTGTIYINAVYPGEIGGSQTVCITKDPAPFPSVMAATAATQGAVITYQWESSTVNCDTGFAPIDGATAETFDPAQGQFPVTTYFRRRATSTLNGVACDAVSNCVILTVLNVDCGQFPWNGN